MFEKLIERNIYKRGIRDIVSGKVVDDTHDFNVSVSTAPVFLAEALTCKWVEGWRAHGTLITVFQQGENVYFYLEWAPDTHDFYGDTIAYRWYHNDEYWEYAFSITEHWYGVWWHNLWKPPIGTGYIEAYWNNIYLGKSNNYTVGVLEGKATIIEVDAPSSFTPGVPFKIRPKVRNDGWKDTLFMSLTDIDTGEVLKHPSAYTEYIPSGQIWTQDWEVTIDQITDFHGLIEVGHET